MIPDKTPNSKKETYYADTTERVATHDPDGTRKAVYPTLVAKLIDATAINLLIVAGNWDSSGVYVGTAITNTFEGQYYQSGNYFYFCYSDNLWLRIQINSKYRVNTYTSSPQTLDVSNEVVLCNMSTSMLVNLPPAANFTGVIFIIKNIGSGLVTIDANGTELIDGELIQTLNQWSSITLISDGSNWFII